MTVIWIARDRNGLTMFFSKPIKTNTRISKKQGIFMNDGSWSNIDPTLFPEITYDNSPVRFDLIKQQ